MTFKPVSWIKRCSWKVLTSKTKGLYLFIQAYFFLGGGGQFSVFSWTKILHGQSTLACLCKTSKASNLKYSCTITTGALVTHISTSCAEMHLELIPFSLRVCAFWALNQHNILTIHYILLKVYIFWKLKV